jgi:hypothetical protein
MERSHGPYVHCDVSFAALSVVVGLKYANNYVTISSPADTIINGSSAIRKSNRTGHLSTGC